VCNFFINTKYDISRLYWLWKAPQCFGNLMLTVHISALELPLIVKYFIMKSKQLVISAHVLILTWCWYYLLNMWHNVWVCSCPSWAACVERKERLPYSSNACTLLIWFKVYAAVATAISVLSVELLIIPIWSCCISGAWQMLTFFVSPECQKLYSFLCSVFVVWSFMQLYPSKY